MFYILYINHFISHTVLSHPLALEARGNTENMVPAPLALQSRTMCEWMSQLLHKHCTCVNSFHRIQRQRSVFLSCLYFRWCTGCCAAFWRCPCCAVLLLWHFSEVPTEVRTRFRSYQKLQQLQWNTIHMTSVFQAWINNELCNFRLMVMMTLIAKCCDTVCSFQRRSKCQWFLYLCILYLSCIISFPGCRKGFYDAERGGGEGRRSVLWLLP